MSVNGRNCTTTPRDWLGRTSLMRRLGHKTFIISFNARNDLQSYKTFLPIPKWPVHIHLENDRSAGVCSWWMGTTRRDPYRLNVDGLGGYLDTLPRPVQVVSNVNSVHVPVIISLHDGRCWLALMCWLKGKSTCSLSY